MPNRFIMSDHPSQKSQILSSVRHSLQNENEDGLFIEKELIKKVMTSMECKNCIIPQICRMKNVEDSTDYRIKGNELFTNSIHNRHVHQRIWKLYSQSIALAPDNSEEQISAYNNRSILFSHMKKYKESIIDCDRALEMTTSNLSKAKLLSRKALALIALQSATMERDCKEILNFLEQLSLEDKWKNKYMSKVKNHFNNFNNIYNKQNNSNVSLEDSFDKFRPFTRQIEAPCASEAVAIKYDEYWGRHIIASRDIQPGEILAVENCYHTFIYPDGMYTHCSNCAKASWNSIPCKYCIYDVYCSEECRCEAWTKYHQYECCVYPHIWDIDEDIKHYPNSIRFTLLSVYKAGGIKKLKNEFISIQQCTDFRSKGFTDEIFNGKTSKCANSLFYNENNLENPLTPTLAKIACNAVYFLATKTNFFEKKVDTQTMFVLNEDILFIGALILRNLFMLPNIFFTYDEYFGKFFQKSMYGVSLFPFCSFFNHSCDSNANFFTSKNNELVIFAKKSIKKNSQIFLAYYGQTFLYKNKQQRMQIYKQLHFTCHCIACTENWSPICLPQIKDLLESSPQEVDKINDLIDKSYAFTVDENDDKTFFTHNTMKEVINILQVLEQKATENCAEYEFFAEYMKRMYIKSFGNWFEVPHLC